jgi:hypothetical protein
MPASPVPPALSGLQPNGEIFRFFGGYARREGNYGPIPEIRQRWAAAGGPGLGAITLDFPSVFDPRYSASSIVIDMLNEALGPQFRPAVETYTTISKRVVEGYYGNGRAAFWFGWSPPFASPSSARFVAQTYAPGSPGQRVTGGSGTHLATIEDFFPLVNRAGFLGIVPWLQQTNEFFRRPSVTGPEPSPFWTQHLDYTRTNRA